MNRVLTAFYSSPWAIIPDRLPVIRAVLHRWASGEKLTRDEIEAAVGDAPQVAANRRAQSSPRGIGVIPVLGVVAQRTAGDISSAGTATDTVQRMFRSMMNDSSIDAIVLDIDSPGGSVYGVQELASTIFEARGRKKVIAHANSLAASAAYWIGAAADEFVVTPGGEVGSIGVVAAHEDHSLQLANEGVDVTLISAGKYKVEGHPFGPLDDEARAAIQSSVNDYYDAFVGAIAKYRGVNASDVRNGFGEGRTVHANDAVKENMADRVESFDATIDRLMTAPRALSPKRRAGTARRQIAIAELEGRTLSPGSTGAARVRESTTK